MCALSRGAVPLEVSEAVWLPSGHKLVPGFDVVADKLSLADRIASADLVVTGEGYLDKQSFAGKAVGGVARLAEQRRGPGIGHRRRRRGGCADRVRVPRRALRS